ncbi:glyoxalase [Aquimarina sp. MMG016]|uniref:glyoxalase n=1 Tax=Aquimarina sp. MMG016 TaxID=2822690 RepID=UPI001B3A0459|nr:glyoxalase [Aquimarina sp. MMG016]MBQ4821262.1 glyoxalase [Aquimarina sp. MMG016]
MENRESSLLALRPQILSARVSENMSSDEQFQNKTIRPIVKLQNDLLIEVFRNYIKKRKNTFYDLTLEKQMFFIENAIQKDMKFRNSLKGMIIGQFTVEEYSIYIINSSDLNKRMMNIVKERLQSNIQLLQRELAF